MKSVKCFYTLGTCLCLLTTTARHPSANPGSGVYEVRDYSVLFTYSDGRKIKLAFLGAEYTKGNPAPASLRMSFNEDQLVRQ